MNWLELLKALKEYLGAQYIAAGRDVPVYLGGWSDVPQIDCVHLIRRDADLTGVEECGGYQQRLYVVTWVWIDVDSLPDPTHEAIIEAGYESLAALEALTIKGLRSFQRLPDDQSADFQFQRIDAADDEDDFVPSFVSRTELDARLTNREYC